MKNKIDIGLLSRYYRIDEDGRILSYFTGRYMKPGVSNAGYDVVHLRRGLKRHIGVHRLVAAMYLGECPEGMEVNHKDGDKHNNHWTNLEYVSHAENVKKSFDNGRESCWKGKKRGPFSEQHREKMSKAKYKPVMADDGRVWESVQACADDLGLSRVTIYTAMKMGQRLYRSGLLLSFIE